MSCSSSQVIKSLFLQVSSIVATLYKTFLSTKMKTEEWEDEFLSAEKNQNMLFLNPNIIKGIWRHPRQ
jgi:hypothetical protein